MDQEQKNKLMAPALNRRTILGSMLSGILAMPSLARTEELCSSATQRDHLGPFYVSDMPVMSNINRFGKPGEAAIVRGTIRAADTLEPIPQARLEVWQTDSTGNYYPNGNGKAQDYADEDLDLRGAVLTDDKGSYEYQTVMPGVYPGRPPHIHYLISVLGYQRLITQHYLPISEGGKYVPCRTLQVNRGSGLTEISAPDILLVRT